MTEKYFIARHDYVLNNNEGNPINISVGNQFILVEYLDNEYVKLKPIDLDTCNDTELILPRRIVEDMSLPIARKNNQISRSQSAIKERICSLNLNDNGSSLSDTCKFSSFGHGTAIHESIRCMSRSSYESDKKEVVPIVNKVENENSEMITDTPRLRQSHVDSNWIRTNEDGTDIFINASTRQRWRATIDDSGRQYFYDEKSRQSAWNLPGPAQIAEDAVKPIKDALEGVIESSESEEEAETKEESDFWDSDASQHEDENIKDSLPSDKPLEIPESNKDDNYKIGIRHIKKEHISGPLFNKLMRTERSGFVEKAKVSENGKEVLKKWIKFHMVLTGPELFFYKDPKAAIPKSGMPQGKSELKLKIQNLQFTEKLDKDSKANVVQMEDTGAPGSNITYLLKFPSPEDMKIWLIALQYAKDWKQEDMYSEKASTVVVTSDKKLLDAACIDDSSGDKQNIKIILKQFLKRRPSPESLEARGILKPEAVFGSSLEILCDQEKNKVPEFVYRCVLAIEARGLHHSGIYRVSGNQAKIQKLRLAVDENKYQLNSEFMELETLTGAFKLFFKELKQPLLDEELCSKLIDLLSNRKVDKKNTYKDINVSTAKKLISKMKPSHYETSKALFGHLKKVAGQSSKNYMDISNISMVWGPNLYSSSGQASTKMAVLLMTHNQIVDFLITRYSELFEGSSKQT